METLRLQLDSPLFGITLTILSMVFIQLLGRKAKTSLLNPLLFSTASIIAFLYFTGIPLESYQAGGRVMTFFLGPVIVSLAVPLYKQLDKLKAHLAPVLLGATAGVLVSITSGILLSLLFGISRELTVSMAPKGTTSAISMELAKSLGGDGSVAIAFVIFAGIFGYSAGGWLLNRAGVTHPLARGLSLGTASHASGTQRAFEMGEEEGAMASLAIGLVGVLTSVFLPPLLRLFGL